MATIAPEKIGTIEKIDDRDTNKYADWYCLRVNPFMCKTCGVIEFVHTDRPKGTIVVWPEKDHEVLLKIAAEAHRHNCNPRIIVYEQSFGPCIPYEE